MEVTVIWFQEPATLPLHPNTKYRRSMNIYCQPLTLFNFSTGIYNFISWTRPVLNQVCIVQFVPKCFCQHPTLLCVITSALIQYHVYQVIKTTLLQTSVFCGFLCNSLTLKACSISLPCSRQVLLWSAHVLYCSVYFDPFCALMSDMGKSIQK